MLALVLYVIACVLLVLAAFNVGHPKLSLGWLGLAIWLFTACSEPVNSVALSLNSWAARCMPSSVVCTCGIVTAELLTSAKSCAPAKPCARRVLAHRVRARQERRVPGCTKDG